MSDTENSKAQSKRPSTNFEIKPIQTSSEDNTEKISETTTEKTNEANTEAKKKIRDSSSYISTNKSPAQKFFDVSAKLNEAVLLSDVISSSYFQISGSTIGSALNQSWNSISPSLNYDSKLSGEISDLKKQLSQKINQLEIMETDASDREATLAELKVINEKLNSKAKIQHIASRISDKANERLMNEVKFQKLFDNLSTYETVVISIDIRRSTELMLKAKTPELFSNFITKLSFSLSQIIIANFGIFDKFTGDGILAFFPKFYSGEDAIIRAIQAANECHSSFERHYNDSRGCFNVFLKDTGLGIGVDFGVATLVNTQSELTVVGIPVVYACRFSSAKAGETLLNQPAKEELERLCPQFVSFSESELFIKNEGNALAYKVHLHNLAYKISDPDWDELTQNYSKS